MGRLDRRRLRAGQRHQLFAERGRLLSEPAGRDGRRAGRRRPHRRRRRQRRPHHGHHHHVLRRRPVRRRRQIRSQGPPCSLVASIIYG